MEMSVDIDIAKPVEVVWAAITDIEHCNVMLPSIISVEILTAPENTLIGLKWRETRMMFGKEATETMSITDAVKNDYYCTLAQSHGCNYISKLQLEEINNNCRLTMTFSGEAQSLFAKIISGLMSVFIKNAMKKELLKDLTDIKRYLERD